MKRTILRSIFLLGATFMGILILLTNCQKKGQIRTKEDAQTNYIEKVKTWFDANPQLNKFVILKFTGEVNWNNAFYHSRDGQTAVELPLKLKKGIAISSNDTSVTKTINRLAFLINDKQQIRSFHEMITTNEDVNKLSKKINYFSIPGNFTGLVILTNQKRVLEQYKQYKNGKIHHFKNAPSIYFCWRIIENFSDGSYRPITEWSCSGGGGGSNGHYGGGGAGGNGNGNGNITAKPCRGNPVKNPEIAAQLGKSGLQGGTFGCTRYESDDTCGGVKGKKNHNGLDIKNAYGKPDYAMYGGTAVLRTQYKNGKVVGAGYYVDVTSVVNGTTIHILYFHMQKDTRVDGQVKAGDIIGYQGNSGNLKNAIDEGSAVSHVHIKVKVNNKAVDPKPYFATKFGTDGKGSSPCN